MEINRGVGASLVTDTVLSFCEGPVACTVGLCSVDVVIDIVMQFCPDSKNGARSAVP